MRRSKILVCLMLALVLVVGMASSAMADYSFKFKFDPSVIKNAGYTSYETCDGTKTAYVDPTTSVSTAYQLHDGKEYVSYTTSSTGSSKRFTYKSPYGRKDDNYRMIGAPNVSDYDLYYVSGTWKP